MRGRRFNERHNPLFRLKLFIRSKWITRRTNPLRLKLKRAFWTRALSNYWLDDLA